MTRTLPALLLAAVTLLGTAACGDEPVNVDGDSNVPATDTQAPAPAPS